MERRLAAILAADLVGYSRQMGADEAGTMARLRTVRSDVIEPLLTEHRGRLFKTTGDGFLAEFSSTVQAVTCALAIQERMAGRNASAPEGPRSELRIGLHIGDVLVEGDDLFGDGVNIAARLESLADPGGICISARVHEDAAGKIKLDVEDLGTPPLKNIAQPVRVFRVRPGAQERPALPLPEKPSLVVLPFQNMSGDPEQDYFADGMVEDITTALSRIGGLFVIARNSAFAYKGKPIDVKQVGRDLGVRYVLEGSVRKSGLRVRITCQLIDAGVGTHLWADRFDGPLDDIFDLQDRVTEAVAGMLETTIERAEVTQSLRKLTANLAAYDLYLRALHLYEAYTRAGFEDAVVLLRRAIAVDPHFARAKAVAADCLKNLVLLGWCPWGGPEAIEAKTLARAALSEGRDDPMVLCLGGLIVCLIEQDKIAARMAVDRSLALNPNSATAISIGAWINVWTENYAAARDQFRRAMRLSPFDRQMRFMRLGLADVQIELGELDEALDLLRKVVAAGQGDNLGLRSMIYALVQRDRIEEAREAARALMRIEPNLTVTRARNSHLLYTDAYRARIMAAFQAAGIPE